MGELYDWASEETAWRSDVTPPVQHLPDVPPIQLPDTRYRIHGPVCRCSQCAPPHDLYYQSPAPVAQGNASAPLLDKVIALVVAFAAMIVGGLVLIPLIVPLLGMLMLIMVVCVAGMAVLLGIVRAVMGSDRPAPVQPAARRRIWR